MDNLHLIHMLFMTKPLNGMNWVENLAQFITHLLFLLFSLVLYLLAFYTNYIQNA